MWPGKVFLSSLSVIRDLLGYTTGCSLDERRFFIIFSRIDLGVDVAWGGFAELMSLHVRKHMIGF